VIPINQQGVSNLKQFLTALAAGVFAVGLMAGAAQAQQKTIKIGTEAAYAPFESKDASGKFVGFDIEFGDAVCAVMKVKCVWVDTAFDGLIPALKAKKIDLIISQMSITDKRQKEIDFSDACTSAPAQLVAKKGSGITPDNVKGKVIGVQSGTTHADYAQQFLKAKGAEIKLYDSQENVQLDLAAGRVDATLADSTIMYDWMQKEGKGQFDYAGGPINHPMFGDGTGIGMRKGEPLKAEINKALAAIKANGTAKKINAKYFPFNIIS
jgi:putative lysine/arginine/ornithine/histidine/octopine transport system substrate-binding protein